MRSIFSILIVLTLSLSAAYVRADADVKTGRPRAIRITPPSPKFSDAERQAELARRRSNVAAKMSDKSMLILFSAEPKLYTNDVNYVFRQENNLYYLTNLKKGGATFVMTKDGATIREYIFLPKRNPQFETWSGKMYSNEEASRISGVKTIIDAAERVEFLQAVKEKRPFTSKGDGHQIGAAAIVYLLLPHSDTDNSGKREFRAEHAFSRDLTDYKIENAQPIFADLRQIKSPYELKLLQHAIDITAEAQMRAMAMVGRAKMEYEVQAEVEYTFRRRNADFWGYPSIVGCGPNATTLHYQEAQGAVKRGDLLLMDVGAEYDHYTADVTRTFPVSGKFTKEQAAIYGIVYDAQEAVAKATKPGVSFADLSKIAGSVIADGLLRLGLITDKKQYGIWYMHGLGHWLGMNVHDVGRYGPPLRAGMVFTNEPGIYIREDALDNLPDTPENKAFIAKVRPVFERYKNIGVRIEDDMLVTNTGVEWMTKNLPRRLQDVEAFMAAVPRTFRYASHVRKDPSVTILDEAFGLMPAGQPFGSGNMSWSGKSVRRGLSRNPAVGGHSHASISE